MRNAHGRVPETCLIEMIFPERANHYGTLFGGEALSLMSKAAFIAASRRALKSVVMARIEQIQFDHPVRVGQLLELRAEVIRVGRTSMTVLVDATAETITTGARTAVMRGSFEMVAVDEAGRPSPIAA